MKLVLRCMISLYLLAPNAWAEDKCPESVQVIEKGQVAICSGVLFSPEASKKADEALEDAKYYKALSDELFKRRDYTIKETDILDKRLKLYMEQSQILATELTKRENESSWKQVGWFTLGVLATGVAVYGASHLR